MRMNVVCRSYGNRVYSFTVVWHSYVPLGQSSTETDERNHTTEYVFYAIKHIMHTTSIRPHTTSIRCSYVCARPVRPARVKSFVHPKQRCVPAMLLINQATNAAKPAQKVGRRNHDIPVDVLAPTESPGTSEQTLEDPETSTHTGNLRESA